MRQRVRVTASAQPERREKNQTNKKLHTSQGSAHFSVVN